MASHEFRERFGYWMQVAAAGTDVIVTRHGKARLRLTRVERPADGSV